MADGFRKNDKTGALEFFGGGQMVAAVDAEWYIITVDKSKGIGGMKKTVKGPRLKKNGDGQEK